MILPEIDVDYLFDILQRLLNTPSPTGYTDNVVHLAVEELRSLGLAVELTRRGAIRAFLKGRDSAIRRAVASHVDTLGAMVKQLKDNGRLEVVPIGYWSARFAEGARVTVFTDKGARRGTILPLKASGHTFNDEIDSQPVAWSNLELRIDEPCDTRRQLDLLGFNIGDHIAIDPNPEISPNGYINSRHLDDKAGVAACFAMLKAMKEQGIVPAMDTTILLTISEEVGTGASTVLSSDVAEMIAIDNGTPAAGQNSSELGVTIAMMDSSGPFDYHLTHKLLELCQRFGVSHQRDVFKFYRCDLAAAVEAGNDIRTALCCFGVDASHGYERTHVDSLRSLGQLIGLYLQSPPVSKRDRMELAPPDDFTTQPTEEAPPIFTH